MSEKGTVSTWQANSLTFFTPLHAPYSRRPSSRLTYVSMASAISPRQMYSSAECERAGPAAGREDGRRSCRCRRDDKLCWLHSVRGVAVGHAVAAGLGGRAHDGKGQCHRHCPRSVESVSHCLRLCLAQLSLRCLWAFRPWPWSRGFEKNARARTYQILRP